MPSIVPRVIIVSNDTTLATVRSTVDRDISPDPRAPIFNFSNTSKSCTSDTRDTLKFSNYFTLAIGYLFSPLIGPPCVNNHKRLWAHNHVSIHVKKKRLLIHPRSLSKTEDIIFLSVRRSKPHIFDCDLSLSSRHG